MSFVYKKKSGRVVLSAVKLDDKEMEENKLTYVGQYIKVENKRNAKMNDGDIINTYDRK